MGSVIISLFTISSIWAGAGFVSVSNRKRSSMCWCITLLIICAVSMVGAAAVVLV